MARIRERDLAIPALEAARAAGGSITTTELITSLEAYFQPGTWFLIEIPAPAFSRRDMQFTMLQANL